MLLKDLNSLYNDIPYKLFTAIVERIKSVGKYRVGQSVRYKSQRTVKGKTVRGKYIAGIIDGFESHYNDKLMMRIKTANGMRYVSLANWTKVEK